MILKMTQTEENALIKLLKNDPIGYKTHISLEDKKRVVRLCQDNGLYGIAEDLNAFDLSTFEDYLVNTIY